MARRTFALALAVGLCASAAPVAAATQIFWESLRPAGVPTSEWMLPGMALTREQGETLVHAFDGQVVELTGYLLPVDRDGDTIHEFMLVPWSGACSHTPPPPPNQLVHVTPREPFLSSKVYDTISVTGVLKPRLERTQLFIMDGVRVLESGYSIGSATVRRIAEVRDPELRPPSPWSFLPD